MRRVLALLSLVACEPSPSVVEQRAGACPPGEVTGTVGVRERCLFDAVVEPYLADPLWTARDAYDAAHYLLVLLHAAYEADEEHWQELFAEHFNAFGKHLTLGAADLAENRLARLQYLYLASEFAVLAWRTGRPEHVHPALIPFLTEETQRLWLEEPAWQWDREPFGNMRKRVNWRLANHDVEYSYYRAIIDEEHFLFVLAANLVTVAKLSDTEPPAAAEDALSFADLIYSAEIEDTPEGGWLFQPGVWTDHRDFRYAGTETFPPRGPAPVEGIAMDTSHAHRFAYWLRALAAAHRPQSDAAAHYRDLLARLDNQFHRAASVPPAGGTAYWRTNNFLDGRNGVYRWDYPTQPDTGYAPYELSGTVSLGWWSALPSARTARMYRHMAGRFPLTLAEIETYVGPNTTRDRHPIVTLPEAYRNGMFELIARVAAREATASATATIPDLQPPPPGH